MTASGEFRLPDGMAGGRLGSTGSTGRRRWRDRGAVVFRIVTRRSALEGSRASPASLANVKWW